MSSIIEIAISATSALAAIAAAFAAWFSYITTQATLNSILNREQPQLDLQSAEYWKDSSDGKDVSYSLINESTVSQLETALNTEFQ